MRRAASPPIGPAGGGAHAGSVPRVVPQPLSPSRHLRAALPLPKSPHTPTREGSDPHLPSVRGDTRRYGGAAPTGKLFLPASPPPEPPAPAPNHARSTAASHRPAWALRAARALGCVGSRPGRCGDSPRRRGVGKRGKSSAGAAGRGNPIGPYGTGNPRGRSRRRRGRTGTRRCPRNRPNGAPRRGRPDAAPAAPVRSERRTTKPNRETIPGRSGPAAAPHRRRRAGEPGGRRPSERGAGPARTGSAARRCSLLTPGALLGNGRRRPHLTQHPQPPRRAQPAARLRVPRGLPYEGRGGGRGRLPGIPAEVRDVPARPPPSCSCRCPLPRGCPPPCAAVLAVRPITTSTGAASRPRSHNPKHEPP